MKGSDDMTKANTRLRKDMAAAGVRMWQVADKIGINATTFTVWMRKPLSPDKEAKTVAAIEQLAASRDK